MKVILLQDVARLGRRFEIVDVPDGYGINKLMPKGLAKPATPANVKAIRERAGVLAHTKEEKISEFKALISSLDEVSPVVKAAANAEGKFFQAIKIDVIVDALVKSTGHKIQSSYVHIPHPIKTIGKHEVLLQCEGVKKSITIVAEAA